MTLGKTKDFGLLSSFCLRQRFAGHSQTNRLTKYTGTDDDKEWR